MRLWPCAATPRGLSPFTSAPPLHPGSNVVKKKDFKYKSLGDHLAKKKAAQLAREQWTEEELEEHGGQLEALVLETILRCSAAFLWISRPERCGLAGIPGFAGAGGPARGPEEASPGLQAAPG